MDVHLYLHFHLQHVNWCFSILMGVCVCFGLGSICSPTPVVSKDVLHAMDHLVEKELVEMVGHRYRFAPDGYHRLQVMRRVVDFKKLVPRMATDIADVSEILPWSA